MERIVVSVSLGFGSDSFLNGSNPDRFVFVEKRMTTKTTGDLPIWKPKATRPTKRMRSITVRFGCCDGSLDIDGCCDGLSEAEGLSDGSVETDDGC